jgi:hypothetical protein
MIYRRDNGLQLQINKKASWIVWCKGNSFENPASTQGKVFEINISQYVKIPVQIGVFLLVQFRFFTAVEVLVKVNVRFMPLSLSRVTFVIVT